MNKQQLKVIEHGEGGQRYTLVTGEVGPEGRRTLVSVVSKKLDSTVEVQPRMTASIKIITGTAQRKGECICFGKKKFPSLHQRILPCILGL